MDLETNLDWTRQSRFTDLNKLPVSINLGSHTGDFLYWGFFEPKYWRNYLHIHSFFEICYAYQGHGIFRIGDVEKGVESGQIFVAKPGEPHEIISDRDDPLGIYFWSYTLLPAAGACLLDHATASANLSSLDHHQRDLNRLLQAFGDSTCWVSNKIGNIPQTLEHLTTEIVDRPLGYSEKIRGFTAALLIDTARAVVDEKILSTPLPESGNEIVEKIIRYLHDNYDRPTQIRDVAAQLHMSERHTSRLFLQAMGVSIQKYLVQLRISIAKQRLLDQSQPVAEIAHTLGYSDARHFSTLFRTHTGMTPTEFRSEKGTQFF